MANYVVFFGYTEQGIRNIKDSPARASLKPGSSEYVRTDTHRAFSKDEFKKIISGL